MISFWLGELGKRVGFGVKADKVDVELVIFRELFEHLQVHDVLAAFTLEWQAIMFGEGEFDVVLGHILADGSKPCLCQVVGDVEIRVFKQ
jgi:hypothetical protein